MKFIATVWLGLLFAVMHPALAETGSTPLQVGVSAPLSGEMAEFGTAVRNGIELARSQYPERLGQVKFIYEDNRYQPAQAMSTVMKLKDVDRVDLLFVWGDHPAAAVAPVVEKAGLPTIAVLTDPRPVRNMQYIIRFINAYEQYSKAMLEHLRSQGHKKIGVVFCEDPYYYNLIDGLRAHLRDDETLTVIANHSPDDADFRTSIARARQAELDALAVYLFPGQVSAFFRQSKQLSLSVPTFGADVFESKDEIRDAQGSMEGALYAHNIVDSDFRVAYVKRYRNDAQIAYAANAYEFALAVASLRQQKQRRTPQQIISAFRNLRPQSTAMGFYQLRQSPRYGEFFDFPIAVKKIERDRIRIVSLSPADDAATRARLEVSSSER